MNSAPPAMEDPHGLAFVANRRFATAPALSASLDTISMNRLADVNLLAGSPLRDFPDAVFSLFPYPRHQHLLIARPRCSATIQILSYAYCLADRRGFIGRR
jgi:hypothetical protein